MSALSGSPTVGVFLQKSAGTPTSSAFIRLLLPFARDGVNVVDLDDPDDPRLTGVNACVVQRIAIQDSARAAQLVARLRDMDVPLVVDTDDAFGLHERFRAADQVLRQLMAAAADVWFSTVALRNHYGISPDKSHIVPNRLEPDLWRETPSACRDKAFDRLRILSMGTFTHEDDFHLILPALDRLHDAHAGCFKVTMVGVMRRPPERSWLETRVPPRGHNRYPDFVGWLRQAGAWDVGIAPLVDTPFNAAKSGIKVLDYLALGLVPIVSEGQAYADMIGQGCAVGCEPSPEAWFQVLSRVVSQPSCFDAVRQRGLQYLERSGFTGVDEIESGPTRKLRLHLRG